MKEVITSLRSSKNNFVIIGAELGSEDKWVYNQRASLSEAYMGGGGQTILTSEKQANGLQTEVL